MKYIATYFPEFEKHTLKELAAVDKNIKTKRLAANISLIETNLDAKEFTAGVINSAPIFLRHIMPAFYSGGITGDKQNDCENILDKAKELCDIKIKAGQFFSVQCRIINGISEYVSKDVEVFIGTHFESCGAIPKFSDYEIINFDIDIISVLIDEGVYYIGCSKASENLNSHSDEYRILSRSGRSISRAENKLKEAICKFNLSISGNGRALDMGAAPGGWTKVLADYGYKVSAVDPAMLHESLYSHPNITHYKNRIENITFEDKFEIIVNDMNVDPQITAKIMCDLADNLIDNGLAIATLKLPFGDVERSISESVDILGEKYEILAIKNLSHNRREVTSLLRIK